MKQRHQVFNLNNIPWLVLCLSLLLTFVFWRAAEKMIVYRAKNQFEQEALNIESAIETRLRNYGLMLQGCIGLFNASVSVERDEWKAFVEAIDPHNNYPGMQGIGFAKRVLATDREAHIRALRSEGFPDYTIQPAGDRAEYFPIIFLEPFKGRNLRAFGYDMFSEQVRRDAMEEARDRGVATISRKVLLVQETAEDIQAGFLLYLPLYEKNRPLTTVQDRCTALQGFVFSPFRINDFINGIFIQDKGSIAFEVYDGNAVDRDAILYRSYASPNNSRDGTQPLFEKKAPHELFGKTWTFCFKSLPAFEAAIDRSKLFMMVCACISVSFLLFIVTFLIVSRSKLLSADLERRQKEQEALSQSEQRYRTIMDQAADALLVCNETGRLLDVNRKACQSLGYSREELLARSIEDIDPEAIRTGKPKQWGKAFAGEQFTFESWQVRKDGSIFPVEVTLGQVLLPSGKAILGIVRDITERKKWTEELLMASQKWRTTFDAIIDPVSLLSCDGTVEQCNRAFTDFLGLDFPSVLGRKCFQLLHEKEEHIPLCPIVRSLKSGVRETMELQVGQKMYLVVADPIREPSGNIINFVHIMRDITDRKRAEEELLAKNAELESFTYAVSHDLRSPLVTVRTFLGHLAQDMAEGARDQVEQDLVYIDSATLKMNALLEELMKFAQVGRVTNPPVEAPLQDIVQEAVNLTAGRIDKRGVRVHVMQDPMLIYGDRTRLVEVFQNLIDNAVKFMGEQNKPHIQIGAEKTNGYISCFVRDNGMGIDPLHKDKLFGLFGKLNPGIEGTGLGLALVKRIVELHGGRIWAESEGTGRGACFWFSLPCKSSEQ
jgi:PAS domain S-box-containing protein